MARNLIKKYPKTVTAVVLVLVVILMDITVANLYRIIVGRTPFPALNAQEIEKSYRIKSEIYHHDLRKMVSISDAVWGGGAYPVVTDSLGFKSRNMAETPLKRDRYRILFIGDSFVEGIGVAYPETFVGLIASNLEKKNIEVLNAAVSSYSPIIYWRKIKHLMEVTGLKVDEIVVYIDISDIEDEAVYYRLSDQDTVVDRDGVRKKEGSTFSARSWLKRNSILLNISQLQIFQPRKKESQGAAVNLRRARWTLDKDLFDEYGKVGLERAAEYMDRLHKLVLSQGIRLTIAVYPWPDQIIGNDLNSIQVSYWQKWSKERGVCFINYFPVFIKPENSGAEHLLTLKKYFLQGDVHWNREGHRLMAETYLSVLHDGRGTDRRCVR